MRNALMSLSLAGGLAAALPACTTVQPALPAALMQDAATLPIKGANGLRGTVRMQTLDGREVRAPYSGYGQSTTVFGTAERRKFKTRFTVEVEDTPTVSADCRADVRNMTLNQVGVSVQTVPMTYGCVFERGGEPVGALDLSELGEGHVSDRSATLSLDGRTLNVLSLHRDDVSGMTLAYPIAYELREGGRVVASVNVAGDRALVAKRSIDPETEEAVRLGAIALSVLSDPATN